MNKCIISIGVAALLVEFYVTFPYYNQRVFRLQISLAPIHCILLYNEQHLLGFILIFWNVLFQNINPQCGDQIRLKSFQFGRTLVICQFKFRWFCKFAIMFSGRAPLRYRLSYGLVTSRGYLTYSTTDMKNVMSGTSAARV